MNFGRARSKRLDAGTGRMSRIGLDGCDRRGCPNTTMVPRARQSSVRWAFRCHSSPAHF